MTERENLTRDAQRFLDGDAHGALGGRDDAAARKLQRASSALRARLSDSDPALSERVMAEIRQQNLPKRSSLAWALEPRSLRVRPWFVPLAAAAMAVLWFAGARYGATHATPAGGVAAVSNPARDTVYVRFEFAAPAARQVHVAGDFNDWRPDGIAMTRADGGRWTVTVPIGVGVHSYQFVVDGASWVPDPAAGARDDGFGGRNSVIVVGPKGVVRS